jgi:L-lysine exporter family protein LysE/ArgO
MFLPFAKGAVTSASLITAIGAQNAFVLKQGILGRHLFTVALLCALIDAVFITFGVKGLGELIVNTPPLLFTARYGGALFLFCYGLKSFYSAIKFKNGMIIDDALEIPTLSATIGIVLAISLLNPHLYLDTVVLIGSIGAQFSQEVERNLFAVGAIFSSFIWFFCLAYGARYLAPLFGQAITWKILDFFIAILMWAIALSLVLYTPNTPRVATALLEY